MRKALVLWIAAALFATAAYAERKAGCEAVAVDDSSPTALDLLASGRAVATAAPSTRHEVVNGKDTKISSLPFVVFNTEGQAIGGGTTTCTATCSGAWCATRGCDPSATGCSPCSCDGDCYTVCTCKKKTTAETAPAPTNPRGPNDRPRSF
ncbi:MAG: hypothetical protein AAF481_01820 [Acidobacteriota bacterium]